MKRKNLLLTAALLAAMGTLAVFAAGNFSVVTFLRPGTQVPAGISVAKIAQVHVEGSAITSGTVVISRISHDNVTTQQLVSVTCTNGTVTANTLDSNLYIVAGERLQRSGTATNGTCRIIVQQ